MASYQTFPQAQGQAETNELPSKKHSQASTIAVMVAALCLGAAYVSTTTGPAWAEEFFTGGGDDGYNPDDSVVTSARARASGATSGTTTCATS